MSRPRYREWVSRIDIERVIEGLGILDDYTIRQNKHGEDEMIGQCPDYWGLHKTGDQTGKFALNIEHKVYNCFVCHGGSLIDLVMAGLNMEPEEALDWLYDLADDTTRSDDTYVSDITKILSRLQPRREEVLPYYNPRILEKYDVHEENLRLWNAGEFDDKPKNISHEVLRRSGVRFAPDAIKYAPRAHDGTPIGDPYCGPAVLFPHIVDRRLVGWQTRWLSDMRPKWVSKYTNTPEFPKGTTLYRPFGGESHLPVIVVESVPTALLIVGHGWPAVATFGAQATDGQLKLLRRFQQGVVIAPDNDKPGVEALIKMANYLEGFIPVSYIEPAGRPGDDLMDRSTHEAIATLLHYAVRLS